MSNTNLKEALNTITSSSTSVTKREETPTVRLPEVEMWLNLAKGVKVNDPDKLLGILHSEELLIMVSTREDSENIMLPLYYKGRYLGNLWGYKPAEETLNPSLVLKERWVTQVREMLSKVSFVSVDNDEEFVI